MQASLACRTMGKCSLKPLPNHITIKDTIDFKQKLNTSKPVLVKFSAPWCGPCRSIAPHFYKLSSKYDVLLLDVDIEQCSDLAEQYSISSLPTFILFNNGKVTGTVEGADKFKMEQLVQNYPINKPQLSSGIFGKQMVAARTAGGSRRKRTRKLRKSRKSTKRVKKTTKKRSLRRTRTRRA
jgi:thioredoxin 1